MLHIWGRLSSINVRKVVWTAQELGLTLQRTDAGGQFGLVKDADFLRLNPNGLVPLIQDDSTTLWESNVIVRYLCAKHAPGTLYPEPLAERFEAEKWMDWQQTSLNPAGRAAFFQWVRTPADQRQPTLIAQSVVATEPLMALLDHHLAHHRYLVGDAFTMADIPVACEVHRWFALPQLRPAWPHLERWYSRVRARPATSGVLDIALS